jgi:predicted glycoside hydrolase/deacetylase ChbG (UPF0249 family)
MSRRYLIVNADDFGQSDGINRGIMTAHEKGIVTSASLMVRWDAARPAAQYAFANPALSVGLHVDLGEWTYRNGEWFALYQVVPLGDMQLVEEEVRRQVEAFCQWTGKPPTHLDSHQHVHRAEPVSTVVSQIAAELRIPLRSFHSHIRYESSFYGQDGRGAPLPRQVRIGHLLELIQELPHGITELGCHPGSGEDFISMYRHERRIEVQTLCDARVRAALDSRDIQLVSFSTVPYAF